MYAAGSKVDDRWVNLISVSSTGGRFVYINADKLTCADNLVPNMPVLFSDAANSVCTHKPIYSL